MAPPVTQQITQSLNTVTKFNKALPVALVVLVALAGFGGLIFWNTTPEYQVLFSNLSPEDAGEMANKLKEKKVPYQVTGGGTTLLVPREQVYDLRLTLAADGLPKGGGVGFEVFDRTNLGVTDFVQKLNYQRALQGELSRTIKQIREIDQVRVHIVTPKESLFTEEQKKATASVLIKTRSGMTLGSAQVDGIVRLVASSVEGLEPGNISVVDTAGKVLSKRAEANPVGQLSHSQLDHQRNIEEGVKRKVQGMLEEVLGMSRAIARVSAEIDFQEVETTEERYDPTGVLRSEQKNIEKTGASQPGPQPAPQPAVQAAADPAKPKTGTPGAGGVSSLAERQNEIRNYEISKVNKRVRNPVGTVRKISAAVIVDGTYKETADAKGNKTRQYQPRSVEEMKSFESIVKKAIGYDEERGDQVEVVSMPFNLALPEEEPKAEKGSPWKEYLLAFYKPAVSVVLALLFLLFVVKPVLNRRSFEGREERALLPQEAYIPAAPAALEPPSARSASQDNRPITLKDQTLQLVHEDHVRTAEIVKTWVHERES